MSVIKGCAIAISMYSKIPVPQFEWDEESMRYALGFFPLIGVFIGAAQMILYFFASQKGLMGKAFYAAAATVLPLIITGGIHMDGYCDTIDALSSRQTRERRLEILKDSRAGAFAVIWTCAYLILCFGMWSEADTFEAVCFISSGYVMSRSLSGIAALFFPCANKKGTLAAFTSTAQKGFVCAALTLMLVISAVLQLLLFPVRAAALLVCSALFFLYYYKMSKKNFGGITGDLAGWFLQCEELLILCAGIW